MLTAMLAARNLLGENHDVWNVNVERSYHESFVTPAKPCEARPQDAERDAGAAAHDGTHVPGEPLDDALPSAPALEEVSSAVAPTEATGGEKREKGLVT